MKKVILTLIVVCLLSTGQRMAAQSDLRFAQITDLHLFDAGYSCYGTDVVEEQKQNEQAIDWQYKR
jgi:hypothetical protein